MANIGPNITFSLLRIATLFAASTGEPMWTYAIAKRLQSHPGDVVKHMQRLENIGWLRSEPERNYSAASMRPPRRLYRMTAIGIEQTRSALACLNVGLPQHAST